MSKRPVVVTNNKRLTLLPIDEPLEVTDAVSENDAATLRQVESKIAAAVQDVQNGERSPVNWSEIENVPAAFIPASHYHEIADVTGLQTVLDTLAGTNGGIFVVVTELPATGESNKIYFVPNSGDTFDEWIYINGTWEQVGQITLDLAGYYTKQETDNLLSQAGIQKFWLVGGFTTTGSGGTQAQVVGSNGTLTEEVIRDFTLLEPYNPLDTPQDQVVQFLVVEQAGRRYAMRVRSPDLSHLATKADLESAVSTGGDQSVIGVVTVVNSDNTCTIDVYGLDDDLAGVTVVNTVPVTGDTITAYKQGGVWFGHIVRAATIPEGSGSTVVPSYEPSLPSYPPDTPTVLAFSYAGGTKTITLENTGEWTVLQNGTWFTISKYSGTGNISTTLSAPPNTTSVSNSGSITLIFGNGATVPIQITQGISSEILTLSSDSPLLQGGSNSYWVASSLSAVSIPVTITSNTTWKMSYTIGDMVYDFGQFTSGTRTIVIDNDGYAAGYTQKVYTLATLSNNLKITIRVQLRTVQYAG